jgi:hypothetical protein
MVDSDEKKTQIVYLGAKGLNADHEDEGWIQKDPCKDGNFNQQLFSFGRGSNKRNLKGTDAVAVFGFLSKGEHATVSEFIKARLADPFKPVGGGTTPTGGAGGSTGAGGATGSGGSTAVTSGGTTATGGSTTTSGGATGSSGGATSSGGSTTAKGGSTTASTSGGSTTSTSGGKTTSTGGSSSTGGSTASSSSGSSGGCSFGLGSEGRGLHGLGLILGFGAVAVWLRGRRRKN